MPSNRRNTRKPLDTEVSQKLEEFEYNFCKYVDTAMPKKFHDTFVKQILLALGEAGELVRLGGLAADGQLVFGSFGMVQLIPIAERYA